MRLSLRSTLRPIGVHLDEHQRVSQVAEHHSFQAALRSRRRGPRTPIGSASLNPVNLPNLGSPSGTVPRETSGILALIRNWQQGRQRNISNQRDVAGQCLASSSISAFRPPQEEGDGNDHESSSGPTRAATEHAAVAKAVPQLSVAPIRACWPPLSNRRQLESGA